MLEEFRFEDLTWPEVNDAVEAGRIPVLPVGTIEQHGPHLPLKIDRWTSTSIVDEAARRSNGLLLAMPPVSYGYTSHVMDFPGSMTIHHETFIRYLVDIGLSLVYHGFKKLIFINGHGSNQQPTELAARRIMLESDAWVGMASWWNLTQANSGFTDTWRDSAFPGGAAHAGEAETAIALHMDADAVRMDLAVDQVTDTKPAGVQVPLGRPFWVGPGEDGRLHEHVYPRRHAGNALGGHGREGKAAVRGSREQPGGVRARDV